MNPASLLGRNHTLIGRTAAVSEGCCAIALSRGGAPKTYHYKHPNEDAAAFAIGPGGSLAVVADAHGGCDASEIAVNSIVREAAPQWTIAAAGAIDSEWPVRARAAITRAHEDILRAVARGALQSSRTTLAFALVRPADDLLAIGAVGDSHAFAVRDDGIHDLALDRTIGPAFLGGPADTAESLHERCVANTHPLTGLRALMLITDGLSEHGIGVESPDAAIADAVRQAASVAPKLRPLEAARSAVESALAAHAHNKAGDNVASAALWLDD
jgi:serine/threonine protein phosphatase PrpC